MTERAEKQFSSPTSAAAARTGRSAPVKTGGAERIGEENSFKAHTIRLSGPLEHDNIVNGDGLRAVLWTQGCHRHCPGCQNPETWDFESGFEVDVEEIKERLRQFKGQTGITFCGGEPFEQPEACLEIANWVRSELGWDVWSFSGYTYEQLKKLGGAKWELVKALDALIDGPFILKERDLTLKFRGSRNQRILHLKNGEITEIE